MNKKTIEEFNKCMDLINIKTRREFHKKYGRKNNTKEQLQEFLKAKLQKFL